MDVSVGIPSYNEGYNLLRLLRQLAKQQLDNFKIIKVIVSDDSSDETPKLVEKFMEKELPYQLIFRHYDERRGVASAWNEIFKLAEGEALLLYDADINLKPHTSKKLLQPLLERKDIGITASNTVPLPTESIAGKASTIVARWLRIVRLRYPECQLIVMGRGLAARMELVKNVEIPEQIIAVDLYLQGIAHKLGWRVVYVDDARVYFRPAETLRDFASQTIRAYFSHRQLSKLIEREISRRIGLREQFQGFLEALKLRELPVVLASYLLTLLYIPKLMPEACKVTWDIALSTKKHKGYLLIG